MVRIGDTHIIKRSEGVGNGPGPRPIPREYHGYVVYINEAHRWYLVEADLGGGVKLREGFKF